MQTRIFYALIAMAVAGNAVAQAVQPLRATGTQSGPIAGGLPPLPPGCGSDGAMPPPRPPGPPASDDSLSKGLGINSAQAAQVQKVFERQRAQAQQLEQQHRNLDAQTCKDLRSILGDQGMARWFAAAPPPPPAGHGPFGPPSHGTGGMMPPPPPPLPLPLPLPPGN